MSERLRLPRGLPDEAYDLGEPTDEFSIGAGRTAGKVALGLVCILGGLVLGVLTVVLIVSWEEERAGGGFRGVFYLGAFAVGLIVGGIVIIVRVLRQTGLRVMACPGGLVYMHGEEAEVIDWGDVEELRYEVTQPGNNYSGSYPRYRLTRHSDGREFIFDNYLPRLRGLGRILERKTLKYLLPEEQEAFDDGEVIRFGPLAVGRKGIRKGGDEWLRWADVKDVEFDRGKGQIVITKEDKWLAWHRQVVNEVPNFHVLLEIVREEMSR
jgi:Family of unknown function (DUF6585)